MKKSFITGQWICYSLLGCVALGSDTGLVSAPEAPPVECYTWDAYFYSNFQKPSKCEKAWIEWDSYCIDPYMEEEIWFNFCAPVYEDFWRTTSE